MYHMAAAPAPHTQRLPTPPPRGLTHLVVMVLHFCGCSHCHVRCIHRGGASSKVYGALTICACRVIFHTPCPCSTNEGLAAGKPLLCMPFGADQFVNAQHIENKGVGLQVS